MNKRALIIIPLIFMIGICFLSIPKSFSISNPVIVQFVKGSSPHSCILTGVTVNDYIVSIEVARVSGGVNGSFMQSWTIADSNANTFITLTGQITSGAQFSSITTLSELWHSVVTNGGTDNVSVSGITNINVANLYCYEVSASYGFGELGISYFNTGTPTNSQTMDSTTRNAGSLLIGAGIGFQTGTSGLTGASFTTCTNADCVTTTDSLTSGVDGALHGVVGSTALSEAIQWDFSYNSVVEMAQSGIIFTTPSATTTTSTTCTSTVTLNAVCTQYIVTVYTLGTTTIISTVISGTSTITITLTSVITSTLSNSNGTLAEVFILFFILMILIVVYVMRRVKSHEILSGDSE